MSLEVKNFIDYFVVCGLDVKSGLEPEPNEAYYGILVCLQYFIKAIILNSLK